MKKKVLLKMLISTLFFSILLFFSAGKIGYLQGWIFFTTNIISALMNYYTIRNNPELMMERSQIGEGSKDWDKWILVLSGLTYLVTIIIAGLDSGRYHWSRDFHWSLYAMGVVITIIGQVIFFSARKKNKYFSTVMRIQKERGHSVCDTGVYKRVRHPGYLGMIISLAAIPLITGSAWSIIPTILSISLLIIRTYLEDQDLKKELIGYVEYAQRTRNRLVPYIW